MSQPAKKKDETGIFSIEGNPFDEGEIPGVTQLLSRGAIPKKPAAAPEITLSSIEIPHDLRPSQPSGTRTNLVVHAALQLMELGVLFELRFHPEGSLFRFSTAQGHKEARLLPWQEKIFDRMKMDKASVPAKEPFEEFTCRKHAFLFDAFGVHPDHFIQIVSPEYTHSRIVLVSDRSVAEHAAKIIEHFTRG